MLLADAPEIRETRVMVRAGVPHPGSPDLLAAAREYSIPILVSANAFSQTTIKQSVDGKPWSFRAPRDLMHGLDVALDSGGFVAMSRYNGYPWGLPAYLDLVASFPWTWYAAMDLCVEIEIAGNRIARRLRIAQTVRNYLDCCVQARDRGLPDPLPVLQGQTVDDYLMCAELMPMDRWPSLVGIGSMCRRDLNGPDNIEAVVEALDKVLPQSTRFHLFGVKSAAAVMLADHPRLASTDSCSWSANLRDKVPTGRNRRMEAEAMVSWWQRQQQGMLTPRRPANRPFWASDFRSDDDPLPGGLEDDLQEWVEMVASGEAGVNNALTDLEPRAAYALWRQQPLRRAA
jgi:hypothetical protein